MCMPLLVMGCIWARSENGSSSCCIVNDLRGESFSCQEREPATNYIFLQTVPVRSSLSAEYAIFLSRPGLQNAAKGSKPGGMYVSFFSCRMTTLIGHDPFVSVPLHAERKKESTLGVSLVSQRQRSGGESGASLYDYEYDLNR